MNTYLATACAVLSWTFGEWMFKGKPSMLGAASGAVAGLVAITPAAGNVGIPGAFVIGIAAGLVCLWGVNGLKHMLKVDDTLDVFGVHAVGGILGALLTGIFVSPDLGGPSVVSDWVTGKTEYPGYMAQLWIQAKAVGITIVWSGVVAFISLQDRRHDHRPARSGRRGTRRSRHLVARRIRVPELKRIAGNSLRAGGPSPPPARKTGNLTSFPVVSPQWLFGARPTRPVFFGHAGCGHFACLLRCATIRSPMISVEYCQLLARYNRWMNERLVRDRRRMPGRGAQARPRRILRLDPPHAQSHPVGRSRVARPFHRCAVHGRAVWGRHVRRVFHAGDRAREDGYEDSCMGGQPLAAMARVESRLSQRRRTAGCGSCRRGSPPRTSSSTRRIIADRCRRC